MRIAWSGLTGELHESRFPGVYRLYLLQQTCYKLLQQQLGEAPVMSLATYLVQRGKRGTWQLRVPIPRALHAPGKPKERVMSMGTTDRRVASDRALKVLDGWKREWAATRGDGTAPAPAYDVPRHTPSAVELEALAVEFGHDEALAQSEMRRRQPGGWGRHMVRTEAALNAFKPLAATNDHSLLEPMAGDIIEGMGLSLEHGSPAYVKFLDDLNAARIAALNTGHARARGNLEATTDSPLVTRVRQREAETAPVGEGLLDLFDRYAEQRSAEGAKRPDVLKQDRKVIEQFADFVGVTRRVESIAPEDIRAFRDALRKLPTRWKERKELAGIGMRAAAAKAETLGLPRVALTTVNKYLSTISPLFAWLIEERYNIVNPCVGLFHQRVKGKNPRPPFSTGQLNTILASPLFVGFERNGREHKSGPMRADDWRYWLPLLAMFTGARIGELAQLHIADVEQHETGVWFVTIRHDAATGQTTKSGHSRPAIVHSRLIELGFLTFVDRQRVRSQGDGKQELFPELEANERDQIGAKPSEFWRDYLAAIGVKSGRDGFGVHSFRHTMADRLREEAGLLDDQIEVALGHNQKTVTGGYGRIRQGTVPLLSGMLEQVTFKGVTLDHLAPQRN